MGGVPELDKVILLELVRHVLLLLHTRRDGTIAHRPGQGGQAGGEFRSSPDCKLLCTSNRHNGVFSRPKDSGLGECLGQALRRSGE